MDTIRHMWSPYAHLRLVEPFVGGMAVALGLGPQTALLNDRNPHLINFYKWMQRGLVIEFQMENNQELYYRYRDRFNSLVRSNQENSEEAAGLFYYLNRTGYNGLCRFNSKGEFNVPFGRYATINYVKNFTHYSRTLAQWDLESGDFIDLKIESGDFIYADPPYDVPFTAYSAGGFSWEDQMRLAQWLANQPGPVVASNQATSRICQLYDELGFTIKKLNAPRRISCTGDRTHAYEMLAYKGCVLPKEYEMALDQTHTGSVFENSVIPALRSNGYDFSVQQYIGKNITGGRHRVDLLVLAPDGRQFPVSMKWQQVSGSADQKVVYEIINLINAVLTSEDRFSYAYLVIGGPGWGKSRDLYTSGRLSEHIKNYNFVRVILLDDFIARANKRAL